VLEEQEARSDDENLVSMECRAMHIRQIVDHRFSRIRQQFVLAQLCCIVVNLKAGFVSYFAGSSEVLDKKQTLLGNL
jgi:hypothetical protein